MCDSIMNPDPPIADRIMSVTRMRMRIVSAGRVRVNELRGPRVRRAPGAGRGSLATAERFAVLRRQLDR